MNEQGHITQPYAEIDLGSQIGSKQWWRTFGLFLILNGVALMLGFLPGPERDRTTAPSPTVVTYIKPDQSAADVYTPLQYEDLSHVHNQPASSNPLLRRAELVVGRGDTLGDLLHKTGVSAQDAYLSVKALSPLFSPKRLRLGQKLDLLLKENGADARVELAQLIIKTGFGETVNVARNEQGVFEAQKHTMKVDTRPTLKEGVIRDSLYLSGDRAGIPAAVLVKLIQIYSFSVDFQREIRQGDRFRVLYEEKHAEDGDISLGNIEFAELVLRGDAMPLYRFTPSDDGQTDYFSPDGKSTRKLLMKTPIDGARLTSRFGRRKHPVLGYVKSHRGVDFGAPTGTPIYAAGNGTVERASRYGSYGNYIRIRHNGTYKTAYAHLSKYARGVRSGARVEQGQVIGYVGATGRVTGAHLHYEVLMNDKRVNPLNLELPTGRNLQGAQLKAFAQRRDQLRQQLGLEYAETPDVVPQQTRAE